jgi:hypothetical protein
MKPEDEKRAVEKVVDELVERHPEVSPDEIKEVVDEEYAALDGNPVRDFIPPLVEHAAKQRLRGESGETVSSPHP